MPTGYVLKFDLEKGFSIEKVETPKRVRSEKGKA